MILTTIEEDSYHFILKIFFSIEANLDMQGNSSKQQNQDAIDWIQKKSKIAFSISQL